MAEPIVSDPIGIASQSWDVEGGVELAYRSSFGSRCCSTPRYVMSAFLSLACVAAAAAQTVQNSTVSALFTATGSFVPAPALALHRADLN
jgi:hypothetical protein